MLSHCSQWFPAEDYSLCSIKAIEVITHIKLLYFFYQNIVLSNIIANLLHPYFNCRKFVININLKRDFHLSLSRVESKGSTKYGKNFSNRLWN